MMGPATALLTSLRRSFDFSGRATRSEFWWTWVIIYFVSQIIMFWRSFLLTQQQAAWGATAVLLALALPMMAVGTRRLVDAGVWRWCFVAVFLFGIFAQIIYRIPLPQETSIGDINLQFDDGTTRPSDLGYFPILNWLRNVMPWIGYPSALLCLLLALLPSRRTPDNDVATAGKVTP